MIRLCLVCCMLVLPSLAQDVPSTGSWLNPRIPIPRAKQFERLTQYSGVQARPTTGTEQAGAVTEATPERCAHIMMFVPPDGIDKKLAIVPGGLQPAMKVTPPMPVCQNDVRQLPERNKK